MIPTPTDATTWNGVTRRNNLLNLAGQPGQFDIPSFKALMEKDLAHGGAAWDLTIYQLIFDQSSFNLYIRTVQNPQQWTEVPLKKFFN